VQLPCTERPKKSLAEQDEIKERFINDPRGHFKTTIADVADSVQWILCFPTIRILTMTGKRELAEMVLKQTKEHFQFNDKLRQLFPELCPKKVDDFGNTTEFTVPRKGNVKEPTMLISSGGSVKAGFHFDIIKCDDLVHEENVGTAEQVAKTIDTWNYTTPLLEPYGYRDTIGTRYDHSDLYGFLEENRPDVAVFKRAAGRLTEDGRITDLLFPERFTEKWLLQQRASRIPTSSPVSTSIVPRWEARRTSAKNSSNPTPFLPRMCSAVVTLFICWDLGFSQKQFADFSVGAVGMFDGMGRCFILDLCVGRFGSWELIENFFKLLIKWKPSRVAIEEAAGSPLLAPALERRAHDLRMSLPLDWLPAGNQKARKVTAIAGLQSLLKQDKLYFVAGLPHYDEMVKQFVRFPKYKHDDIPDSVSMLMHYRDRVDYYMPDSEVEFAHVLPIEGCEVLGRRP
jgi:phage terminase large subunit-like protein